MTTLAVTGNSWLEVVLTGSIVIPLAVLILVAWLVMRGRGKDPDEQRWQRLAQQQQEHEEAPAEDGSRLDP